MLLPSDSDRSIKEECVDRMIFFGRSSLERALVQYIAHYHNERNHQAPRQQAATQFHCVARRGHVRRHERSGGMLSFYYRGAA
jgi:putative transposase